MSMTFCSSRKPLCQRPHPPGNSDVRLWITPNTCKHTTESPLAAGLDGTTQALQ
jgi:hypothetical protein